MTNRERLTELRYQMEKNSFILSIIEARIAVILHAEEMGYPDTETGLITKTSPQYVAMVRALKDKYSEQIAPNGLKASSIEELAQIIYDKVYVEDHKYAGQFSKFDTELLDRWFELKQQQEALFDSIIDRQHAQAVFRDAYFQKFGTQVSIREIQEKPEQKQEEEEPEIKMSNIGYTQKREHQMELIANMVQNGAITFGTAFEYMNDNNDFRDLDEFTRILDIWIEKGGKIDE